MNHDPAQQMLPGLDLSWIPDCANILLDCDGEVEHLATLAHNDDLGELETALREVHQKLLTAGRIAVALTRQHKIKGTLVGDTERDGEKV